MTVQIKEERLQEITDRYNELMMMNSDSLEIRHQLINYRGWKGTHKEYEEYLESEDVDKIVIFLKEWYF